MKATIVLRWTARIWSIASLVFIGAFVVGSVRDGEFPTERETVALAFFPVGVALGFVIAWWREALGGAITVASLASFYLWMLADRGRFPTGPYFILLAAPGFLFLVNAMLERCSSLQSGGR